MIHILHISDLHFIQNAASYYFEEVLLKEASQKLQNIPRGKKLLIVTGDFHNFRETDYQKAKDFILRLVSKTGLDMEKDVFVIPGNHDVGNDSSLKSALGADDPKWKMHQKASLAMLKNGDMTFIEDRLQSFRPYSTFVRNIGIYDTTQDVDYPASSHVRSWRGKLNILHLNTALIADGTSKKDQITDTGTAAQAETWKPFYDERIPSLAIGHNNYYDLKKEQRKDLATIFELRNVSAYLCGDMHRREENLEHQMIGLEAGYRNGKKIPNLVAARGIADGDEEYSEAGFCWHQWDEETDHVTVEFRKWTRDKLSKTISAGETGEYEMRREKPAEPGSKDEENKKSSENRSKTSETEDSEAALRSYLADVLQIKRDRHPSFQLLKADEIDTRLFPKIKEYETKYGVPQDASKSGI